MDDPHKLEESDKQDSLVCAPLPLQKRLVPRREWQKFKHLVERDQSLPSPNPSTQGKIGKVPNNTGLPK